MQLFELKKATKQKTIPPILIFVGNEQEIMKIYSNKIGSVYGMDIRRIDSMKELVSEVGSKNFGGRDKLFIVRDSKEFQKNDKLWTQLPTILKKNKVIFIYSAIDKREKFYKQFYKKPEVEVEETQGFKVVEMVEFERLTGEQLTPLILKEIDLGLTCSLRLAEMCAFDYGRILLEVDKLKNLHSALNKSKSYQEVFEIAVYNKLIYTKPEEKVFEFVELVLRNDYKNAFKMLVDLQALKTSEILLLSLLYTNFRNVLLIQGCKGGATAEKTGLSGWQIHNSQNKTGYFTLPELIDNLKVVREVEKGIKTGLVDAKIAMDYLLCSVLR